MPEKIIRSLREQLDEARETILQLRQERKSPAPAAQPTDNPARMSQAEWVICEALYRSPGIVHPDVLIGAIDAVRRRPCSDPGRSLNIAIHTLRRKLGALVPPISIQTSYGEGYYFDKASRALFKALRAP